MFAVLCDTYVLCSFALSSTSLKNTIRSLFANQTKIKPIGSQVPSVPGNVNEGIKHSMENEDTPKIESKDDNSTDANNSDESNSQTNNKNENFAIQNEFDHDNTNEKEDEVK